MPLTEFSGTLGKQRAAHLLRRCGWGGTIPEIDEFASLTATQAFDRLTDDDIPDPILPVDGNGDPYVLLDQEGNYVKNPASSRRANQVGTQQHHHETGLMAAYGGVPDDKKIPFIFRERLCYFFYTLYPTNIVGSDGLASWRLQQLFRLFAFDKNDRPAPKDPSLTMELNIRNMTKKMVLMETIMIQLDGDNNFKSNPNENLGRELLELYTIGRGLDGFVPETPPNDYFTHTEQDVQAASRILTGWTFRPGAGPEYDPETGLRRAHLRTFAGLGPDVGAEHDNGIKQFSDRFGNAQVVPNPDLLIDGQPSEASMLDEVNQMIDIIFNQRETARHICRRLYRFLVHYNITQDLSDDIIEQMADAFINSGFKLYPALQLLLTSKHFYDGENANDSSKIGGLIKSPHDLFIGFGRIMDIDVPNPYGSGADDADRFQGWATNIRNRSRFAGQEYHNPPTVAGHPAYFQFPNYNRSWLTSNWLATRYTHIRESINADDALEWVRANFPDEIAGDAKKLVIAIIEYFLPISDNLSFDDGEASPITINRLNSFLSSFLGGIDADPLEMWSERYLNGIGEDDVARQLENLMDAVLQSPEYQLL